MPKVIYLISTYKCSACKCQEYLLKKCLENRTDIELKVIDCSETPDWIKTNIKLTDFPTTILVDNNVIKHHFVGTKAVNKLKVLLEDIDF